MRQRRVEAIRRSLSLHPHAPINQAGAFTRGGQVKPEHDLEIRALPSQALQEIATRVRGWERK
jgi:hypothetical protein